MAQRLDPSLLRLYAITADGMAFNPDARRRVREWLQAGVRAIQLRDKRLGTADVMPLGRFLRAITAEYQALFIVNDNPRLALELGADGCHLGQDDMDIDQCRAILGPDRIVGVSTHSRRQALAAVDSGADYIGIGPIFQSSTKDVGRELLGPALAGWATRELALPVVAIGGITLGNVGRLAEAGCRSAAVIGEINQCPKPAKVARTIIDILDTTDSATLR